MAVRAAGAGATMDTPVRKKPETPGGIYSPDSVLQFDSLEPAEKASAYRNLSDEDRHSAFFSFLKNYLQETDGLSYDPDFVASQMDIYFGEIPAHPTKRRDLIWEELTKPIRDYQHDLDGPRRDDTTEHLDLLDEASILHDNVLSCLGTNMNSTKIDRPLVPTLTISGISTNAAATIVLTGTPKRRDPLSELIKIPVRCYWHDSDGPQFDGASLENVDLQDETRAHGRPPDSRPPKSHTSDQHDTSVTFSHVFVASDSETTHVSYARVPIFLAHPQLFSSCFLILLSLQLITINLTLCPTFCGILDSAPFCNRRFRRRLAWRRMTVIAPLAVKTSSLGAIKSIIRSIPWPDQNNQPFGSTFSPLLTDSGVCLDIRRSCSTCDVIIPDA